jgi:hypothetical protein
MLYYTSRPGIEKAHHLANNQLVTTQKLNQGNKSGNQNHQLAYQKHSCTSPSTVMGRRRNGNHSPQKKKQ